MNLVKFVKLTGYLVWEGGRVGGQKESVEIAAATDNPIVRHPITNIPYLPGSSLKGKIRSLIELSTETTRIQNIDKDIAQHKNKEPSSSDRRKHDDWANKLKAKERIKKAVENGEPCGCGLETCKVCTIFGPHKNTDHELGPTRVIFRDANIVTNRSIIKDIQGLPEECYTLEDIRKHSIEKGLAYAEIKSENIINRHTGRAADPRQMERVIPGTLFNFEIVVKIFEGDNEEEIVSLVKNGINLLENDYLGGSGSRGYGKVKFYAIQQEEHYVLSS